MSDGEGHSGWERRGFGTWQTYIFNSGYRVEALRVGSKWSWTLRRCRHTHLTTIGGGWARTRNHALTMAYALANVDLIG